MIFIVTGDGPRCGSAMMMSALRAGGIELAYNPESDEAAEIQIRNGYHPNLDGLFELTMPEYVAPGFPDPAIYDGKAIKIFPPVWGPLSHIVEGKYKVVWLHRDRAARMASYRKFHEKHPLIEQGQMNAEEQKVLQYLRDMAAYDALHFCACRKDMDVIEVEFNDVVDDPLPFFQALESRGWPIDPDAAAKIPDSSRRRFGAPARI